MIALLFLCSFSAFASLMKCYNFLCVSAIIIWPTGRIRLVGILGFVAEAASPALEEVHYKGVAATPVWRYGLQSKRLAVLWKDQALSGVM